MATYTIGFKWNDWYKEIPKVFEDAKLDDVKKEARVIVQNYARNAKEKVLILVKEMKTEGNKIVHEEEVIIS